VRWPGLISSWGSTPDERARRYACDDVVVDPDQVLFRAVDVDASPAIVFRWLCQLRVAPYSYDVIDNRGRRSPHRLIDGLDELEVGQRFMTIFRLVDFVPGRSITLDSTTTAFGHVGATYDVSPSETGGSRLVVKLLVAGPHNLYGALERSLLAVGDLVMMRKQLRTLQALAERAQATRSA
jgi:hypothetical protein